MTEPVGCPTWTPCSTYVRRSSRIRTSGGPSCAPRAAVAWVERLDAFVVTDYDAAEEALTDHERFLSGAGNPRGPVLDRRLTEVRAELAETSAEFRGLLEQMHPDWRRRHVLLAADGDEHTAHRRLVRGMFTARRAELLRPRSGPSPQRTADSLGVDEPVELVEAYLNAVPMRVVADQLGIDPEHLDDFRRWATANDRPIGKNDFPDLVVEATRSNVLFAEYFRGLMDQRLADPRDDFTTRLVECDPSDGSFDDEIRLNMMSQLIGAGNDTTSKALADATVARPATPPWPIDSSPTRRCPRLHGRWSGCSARPRVSTARRAATPSRRRTIPAGSAVLVSHASANRTASRFASPTRWCSTVSSAKNHLAFSKGKHFRAAPRWRALLMTEALLVLLERFGGWTIDERGRGCAPTRATSSTASTDSGSASSRCTSTRG